VKFLARFFFLISILPLLSPAAPDLGLVVEHVTVMDGTGRAPELDQTVAIVGGRITSRGPAGQVKIEKTSRVIDGRGKFLIPGLWDMHVHVAGVSADPAWSRDVLLPLLLANGVTGVRDMGGDLETLLTWKREVESGALVGPHIVACGPWLASRGRKSSEQFPVANADEARAAVRELKQRGADFIKIISLPSREAFFAVADESRKQAISFVGHLPLDVDATEASGAGMHSIEHLFYSSFSLSLSTQQAELRKRLSDAQKARDYPAQEKVTDDAQASYSPEKAAALWQTLKKNHTWITPTLASLDISSHPQSWDPNDLGLAYVPPDLAKQWRTASSEKSGIERAAWMQRQASNDSKLTGEMHRAGVSLLIGSDSLDPFVFPGDSLHGELEQVVRAGFTPAEAIQAATRGAAQFLGREKDFGTIEVGKAADLVLLDANPMENIANSRKILAVIYNGRLLDRTALDAMLARARSAAAAAPARK
jgi:imidazolonepropionase-like amidohydrolase